MCVLALAWRAHPRWPIVLAGNRDEFHQRPASPLARWDAPSQVIAGRDLQSGGTWLAVSELGRLAVVTNLRGYGAPAPDLVSRGALVGDVVAGVGENADLDRLDPERFNPFNLIVVDAGQARFLCNRPQATRALLDSGIHGLSNGALDEPWPKTLRLKSLMAEWLQGPATEPTRLLDGLREAAIPPIGVPPADASDIAQEPRLSSIFIDDPIYGTRCSTVVAIDHQGHGVIIERRFTPDAARAGDTSIPFNWPG